MQFGVDVGCDLLMFSQFVRQELETPAYVAVAIERAHATVFAVDERLAFMEKARHVIEARADKGGRDDFIDVLFRLVVVANIEMPRIDVRIAVLVVLEMVPMTDAHVLDEARGVHAFCHFPHGLDPLLWRQIRSGFRFCNTAVSISAGDWREEGIKPAHLSAKAPRLVKQAPREDRRMVEIALNGLAHHLLEAAP